MVVKIMKKIFPERSFCKCTKRSTVKVLAVLLFILKSCVKKFLRECIGFGSATINNDNARFILSQSEIFAENKYYLDI